MPTLSILTAAIALNVFGWDVSDTTNNVSGVRVVMVSKASEYQPEDPDMAAMIYFCMPKGVSFKIMWPRKLGTKFASGTITINRPQGSHSTPKPITWVVDDNSDGKVVKDTGDAQAFLDQWGEGASSITFYFEDVDGGHTELFDAEGIKEARQYATSACNGQ